MAKFGIAFLVLNALLTFENAAPGIGIRFAWRLSFELCLLVAALSAWVAWRGPLPHRAAQCLAAVFVFLGLVRYVDVTVAAVFGRPVNAYWDGRHGFDALRLSLEAVPGWQIVAGVVACAAGLFIAYRLLRWAISSMSTALSTSLSWSAQRPVLLVTIAALCVSFAAYKQDVRDTRWFFSLPIAPTLVRQAQLLPGVLLPGGDASLPASPSFNGNVAALRGADVLLIFAESYGVTAFDDPVQNAALQASRSAFGAAIAASGRHVVSARIKSPTFASGSWLAHAALLSGVDTRRPGAYDVLLASKRPTLVSHFASHGYRTVGWMPGLQKPWPEGGYYGFDRIAGVHDLRYSGLEFGFWRVPDQAAMGLLHEQELERGSDEKRATPSPIRRQPRFVVFPTLATHVPFRPLPPLIADASKITQPDAYSVADLQNAMLAPVTWDQAVPAYVESMRYQYGWLGAYLQQRANRGTVMIVIGDHQPLAAVSGQKASWDVPMHVIADDPDLLKHFVAHGFAEGLQPPRGTLTDMSGLTRTLIEIFTDPSG